MRCFAHIAYHGARYHGWQCQPNSITVQGVLENAFSTILNREINIVGCGRTDTGVHASSYYFHFDYPQPFPPNFEYRINKFLPADIVVYQILKVPPEAHARFDAVNRSYHYQLSFIKDPFRQSTATYLPIAQKADFEKLQQAGQLLLQFSQFYPFCKSDSDTSGYSCQIKTAQWSATPNGLVFNIQANRFLRGMVRLIVGMCLNVGWGKLTLQEVTTALEGQTRLKNAWSAPPEGLFLSDVKYPYPLENLSIG
jgi:tRNA pseudouridine38-40 synthase